MSADPIIYCLEHLTDYRQFERLCSDAMIESGYPDLEPLGGSSDGGRDALHVSRTNPSELTIFAYSVRGDWERKLFAEDCVRIRDEGHTPNRVVFVCTAGFTANERDKAKEKALVDFGWDLELYGLERIRTLLSGQLRHLVARHPAIFCPPFFPTRGGLSIAESRDTLVIDHVLNDHGVATWLARRLQLAGYRTWCFGTAPLAGETADNTVRSLIECRAARYLPILSPSSVNDADFVGRCSFASNSDGLTIPCHSGAFDAARLPARIKSLTAVPFASSWAEGFRILLKGLGASGLRTITNPNQATAIALRSYVPEPVVHPSPEPVYTNTFAVELPTSLLVSELTRQLTTAEEDELRKSWAFAKASSEVLLAFDEPPRNVPIRRGTRLEEYSWRDDNRYRKRSTDAVKELVRRSIDVACHRVGMQRCLDREVFFFPQQDAVRNTFPFVHVDGRKTRVALAGEKTQGSGERARPFRYQLCPTVRVGFDDDGDWWLTMKIYVRVTDREGVPFEKKAIGRRRKTVTKSWWNKHWLARTLGMMQTLSGGNTAIRVGAGKRQVAVSCRPMEWSCPVSIDYRAVERVGDFHEEMAELRYHDDEELDDEQTASEVADG